MVEIIGGQRGAVNETSDTPAARTIAEAVNILPGEKREFILGYAEGVIAASNIERAERGQDSA